MSEKGLLVMDGFCVEPYHQEGKHISKLLAILDPDTKTFKGIEITAQDCDLNNRLAILQFVAKKVQEVKTGQHDISLLVGYYEDHFIQYSNMVHNDKLMYACFSWSNYKKGFVGREKHSGKRDESRPVNQYTIPMIVYDMPELYDMIEYISQLLQNNVLWKGIQISMEEIRLPNQTKRLQK